MTCPLCFEDMDMSEFRDARASTETCYKLECGHAFHTKCVVGVLQQTMLKCPTCNHHKTPEQKAKMEQFALQVKAEIGKNPEVRALKEEQAEAKKQMAEVKKQWQKEVRAYAKARAAELLIPEKRDYYNKAKGLVEKKRRDIARAKGPIFLEALKHQERRRHRRDWQHHSLVHPRVWMQV